MLPELETLSVRFLDAIDYHGLVELEYKLDPRDGAYRLLDVNARTWGYHSLGAAAGVDFPLLLWRDQLGMHVPDVRARAGGPVDPPGDRRAQRRARLPAGALRPLEYLRTLRGTDTEAVFSLRDPLPGLMEVALLPYLAVRRGL